MSQQFCLKWNNHMNNMMDVFKNLLSTEAMVDVTLACDGLSLKAHKIVLSACSPFFQSLFLENPCKHPIVILKDMKYTELKAIIEFMYHGEVNVAQDQLSALMKTAETLRVKGLAEVTNEKNQSGDESSHRSASRTDTPPPKRRRGRTRKRSLSDQSDDGASEPKIKQPDSDIEELSGDMDPSTPYSTTSNVPLQSHNTNSFHKSQQEQPVEQGADESFVPEEKFGVEPSKLLEQTLTTDDLPRRSGRSSVQSNMELQRRPRSSTDHSSSLVPVTSTPMSSDALVANQQPESPPDIKPELLDLEPPMSPVAGPSHSTDENSMMMYMDQSSMSTMPGPSGYQDNSALVSTDSQPQGIIIKLELPDSDENIETCLHDSTEVDKNESLKLLPVAYRPICLLQEIHEKPWLADTVENITLESVNLKSMPSTSGNNKDICNLNLRNLPWPKDFDFECTRFSTNLLKQLQSGKLKWAEKAELMNHLSEKILLYTENPSVYQRNQVAKVLIEKFPSLKTSVGDGYHVWSNRIYDKMREIRRKKRKHEEEFFGVDSEMTVTKNNPQDRKVERVQRRGVINWAPPPPDGEDITSMVAHKEWLIEEFKKGSTKDKKLVVEKMELCFSLRRAEINKCQSLSVLKQEYPFMFTLDGILREFHLFTAVNIAETFVEELNQIASKLISIAQRKKKMPQEVEIIINCYNAVTTKRANDSLTTSLLLLPFLLLENPEYFYEVYPTETALESINTDIKTPHVAVIGSPLTSELTYIIADGAVMFKGTGFVQAVMACIALYYCCNIHYPTEAKCVYNFIQIKLLKLQNSETVPRKVHTLIEKLNL